MKSTFIITCFLLSVYSSVQDSPILPGPMSVRVKQKTTPFVMKLPRPLFISGFVNITGIPKCYPNRISIWLMKGPDYKSNETNCPLQLDLHFKDDRGTNFIKLSSRQDGEQSPRTFKLRQPRHPKFPIDSVGFFNILITVAPRTFTINFSGWELELKQADAFVPFMHLAVLQDVWIAEVYAKSTAYIPV